MVHHLVIPYSADCLLQVGAVGTCYNFWLVVLLEVNCSRAQVVSMQVEGLQALLVKDSSPNIYHSRCAVAILVTTVSVKEMRADEMDLKELTCPGLKEWMVMPPAMMCFLLGSLDSLLLLVLLLEPLLLRCCWFLVKGLGP